jgi:hypothetical protein
MTTTTMAREVDNDDNEGDDASLTGYDEGDNRNHDNGKDACASVASRQEAMGPEVEAESRG